MTDQSEKFAYSQKIAKSVEIVRHALAPLEPDARDMFGIIAAMAASYVVASSKPENVPHNLNVIYGMMLAAADGELAEKLSEDNDDGFISIN